MGQALEIAGSELTNLEAAEVFGRVLGKKVRFRRLRSFTKCSAGSIMPVSKRTLKGSAGAIPKFIFGLSRNGCATKDGTSPRGA